MAGVKVALTAPPFAGKTTIAHLLRDRGFYFMDYTGYLKQLAAKALHAVTGEDITAEYIEQNKKEFRAFLQAFGDITHTYDGFGINHMLDEWWDNSNENVVFDNIRYQQQFTVLNHMVPSFVLVGLTINSGEQERRAAAKGVSREDLQDIRKHHAETGALPDFWLRELYSPEANANIFLRMAGLRPYDTSESLNEGM